MPPSAASCPDNDIFLFFFSHLPTLFLRKLAPWMPPRVDALGRRTVRTPLCTPLPPTSRSLEEALYKFSEWIMNNVGQVIGRHFCRNWKTIFGISNDLVSGTEKLNLGQKSDWFSVGRCLCQKSWLVLNWSLLRSKSLTGLKLGNAEI